jgi:hypothetical protein
MPGSWANARRIRPASSTGRLTSGAASGQLPVLSVDLIHAPLPLARVGQPAGASPTAQEACHAIRQIQLADTTACRWAQPPLALATEPRPAVTRDCRIAGRYRGCDCATASSDKPSMSAGAVTVRLNRPTPRRRKQNLNPRRRFCPPLRTRAAEVSNLGVQLGTNDLHVRTILIVADQGPPLRPGRKT